MSAQLQRLPQPRRLSQHLVACPMCGKPSAAHVDDRLDGVDRLVRLVCPDACSLSDAQAWTVLTSLIASGELEADSVSA